jgi:hypothetical protein
MIKKYSVKPLKMKKYENKENDDFHYKNVLFFDDPDQRACCYVVG